MQGEAVKRLALVRMILMFCLYSRLACKLRFDTDVHPVAGTESRYLPRQSAF